jgi:heme exporter protein D
MTHDGKLSFERSPTHDYSEPGTYHLVLPVRESSPPLGSYSGGILRLNEYGEAFLDFIGIAQHRQPHVRVDALNILPMAVILVVTILSRRNIIRRVARRMLGRLYHRRTMMIPMFVGQLKMTSARRINALRGVCYTSYWTIGYLDRVVRDQEEIARLIDEVGRDFLRVGLSEERCAQVAAQVSRVTDGLLQMEHPDPYLERPMDSMLLGRAYLLLSRLLRPLPTEEATSVPVGGGTSRGGTGGSHIRCIGPGIGLFGNWEKDT